MAISPADRQRTLRLRKKAERAAMPTVLCQCGCGTLIPSINTHGQPASYAHGHNPKGETTRFQRGKPSWNKGKPNPDASKYHKGKTLSPEVIARRTATRLANNNGVYQRKHGWKHTEQTIQHMTEAVHRRDMTGANNPFYGKKHAPGTLTKISEQISGELNWGWKGGTGTLPYGPEFTRKFKRLIRERDHYTCQRCGSIQQKAGKTFHVHHIDEDKANNDPQNLATICPSCHVLLGWQKRKKTQCLG